MPSIYKQHSPGNTSDLYIKLLDQDVIKGRIVSEPAISVYKPGAKPRYSWIIFVRSKNNVPVNKPQILTKGISVYNAIGDLVEDWGEPTEYDVAIRRTGSGLNDTEYSVTPLKTGADLTKLELEEVNKINLPQAIKGKWLADYVEDEQLPDPITDGGQDEVVPMPNDDDAPINLDDLPY